MADSQPETMLVSDVRALLGKVWATLVVAEDCAFMLAELQRRGVYKPRCDDGKPSRADASKDHAEVHALLKRLHPIAFRDAPVSLGVDVPIAAESPTEEALDALDEAVESGDEAFYGRARARLDEVMAASTGPIKFSLIQDRLIDDDDEYATVHK